ncbi:hypothetical protein [Halovivax cerinus]|uniref:Uncharacterized protein n=1 Tax=Halovivax cerinus TaxID=1487865 RepID=A0ABD5NKD1_9EURY|nr:hypothetical protein [Halovivax cerinus]
MSATPLSEEQRDVFERLQEAFPDDDAMQLLCEIMLDRGRGSA